MTALYFMANIARINLFMRESYKHAAPVLSRAGAAFAVALI